MIPITYQKIIMLFILISMVFNLYELLLHGLFLLFHALFSVAHVVFEWFEYTLEHLIQHVFHTTRKQSQVIVFYLLLLIGLGLARYFLRKLPCWYQSCQEYLFVTFFRLKYYIFLYWHSLPSSKKIKLITTCTAGISCLAFLSF